MKGIQKVVICLALILCTCVSLVACNGGNITTEVGQELVVNGSFEQDTEGWEIVGVEGTTNVVEVAERSSGTDQAENYGSKYLKINNKSRGETYLKQTIRLEPGATYKLESQIIVKTAITGDSATDFKGAFIGMNENVNFPHNVDSKKSSGQTWGSGSEYSYYFTSEFDTITLAVRLGLDGKEVKGEAHFDSISIKEVDPATITDSTNVYTLKAEAPDNGSLSGILYLVLGVLLVLSLSYGVYVALRRKGYVNRREVEGKGKFLTFVIKWYPLAILLFVALAVRITLSLLYLGTRTNMEAFSGSAIKLSSVGLNEFYASSAQRILPLHLYLLWACGGLINLFGAKGAGLYMLVKLPAILAELGTIIIIYKLAKKFFGDVGAILCGALYAFIPSTLTAISVWGEMDSITAFFALLTLYLILNPNEIRDTARYIGIFICLLLGSMVAVEYLWLVPVVLAYIVVTFIKKKDTRLLIGVCAGSALVLFYVLNIPFCINYIAKGRVFYVFEKYWEILFGGARNYSQDAFNLYSIVGLNWRNVSRISLIMNAVFAVILFAFVIFVYLKNKSRIELILLSAFTLIGAYTFAIDMSPTVLIVGITLLMAYAIIVNEKRAYLLVTVYSLLLFVDCAVLMNASNSLSSYIMNTATFKPGDAFLIVMSVVNLLTFFGFVYLIYDICINDKIKQIEFIEGRDVLTLWGRLTYKIRRK